MLRLSRTSQLQLGTFQNTKNNVINKREEPTKNDTHNAMKRPYFCGRTVGIRLQGPPYWAHEVEPRTGPKGLRFQADWIFGNEWIQCWTSCDWSVVYIEITTQ